MCIAFVNQTGILGGGDCVSIAPTEFFAKLWITHTEYTVSQKTIDGEINTICDFRYVSSIQKKREAFGFVYVYSI